MHSEPLALLLLRASRWFDRQLLDGLEELGWTRLTPAQSLVFAHLRPTGVPPAELARRLGTTRQAAQDMVAGLVRLNLVRIRPDPARRGGRLVELTDEGKALSADARRILADLERGLGPERGDRLRSLLGELGHDQRVLLLPDEGFARHRSADFSDDVAPDASDGRAPRCVPSSPQSCARLIERPEDR